MRTLYGIRMLTFMVAGMIAAFAATYELMPPFAPW